jgi:hypothetical protein
VLPVVADLTFGELDDQAIAILTDLLSTQRFGVFHSHIFAHIAPEKFIAETLLPLAKTSDVAQLRHNIAHLIDVAGKRLAIRFELSGQDLSHDR